MKALLNLVFWSNFTVIVAGMVIVIIHVWG